MRHDLPRSSRVSHPHRARRGNAMILVAGLLVLLVIVVTAFITRTRAGRETATAFRDSAIRDTNVDLLAESIAEEVSEALFPRLIDPTVGGGGASEDFLRNANLRRLPLDPDSPRYAADPTYPFQRAPYAVVPWTNWPDEFPGSPESGVWPLDPVGAPTGVAGLREANPIGNPGSGDSRWLRDLEPIRWEGPNADVARLDEAFLGWRHLTNISRSGNGYRIVGDLSNVDGSILGNLNWPVEQWTLLNRSNAPISNPAGGYVYEGLGPYFARWENWLTNYPNAYRTPGAPPPNFLNLADLNGNGINNDPGERPFDEFVRNTPRWDVSRTLADTDGDGFTDSFWFTAPGAPRDGIRQVVAVSIVDNAAMLDANVATRFAPGAVPGQPLLASATAGETPADLALVGGQLDPQSGGQPSATLPVPSSWNVGMFDRLTLRDAYYARNALGVPPSFSILFPEVRVAWSPLRWADLALERGVETAPAFAFVSQLERRFHWQFSGSVPLEASRGYTPFTQSDELELRSHYGNNLGWSLSRFERAVNLDYELGDFGGAGSELPHQILRSARVRQESSELLGRLSNYELFADQRHRVTTYSGARNDLKPPALQWRWPYEAPFWGIPTDVRQELQGLNAQQQQSAFARFHRQGRLKMDLREWNPGRLIADNAFEIGERPLHRRLSQEILHALNDGLVLPDGSVGQAQGYTGLAPEIIAPIPTPDAVPEAWQDLRAIAAGLSANILSRRDRDYEPVRDVNEDAIPGQFLLRHENVAPVYDEITASGQAGAVPLPQWGRNLPTDFTTRMLGLEPQPFLVEAFIAHVHESEELPKPPAAGGPYDRLYGDRAPGGPRDRFVDDDSEQTTVVVVQLANPFDVTIPWEQLRKYKVRVFGQDLLLGDVQALALAEWDFPPATTESPVTLNLVLCDQSFSYNGTPIPDFRAQWLDFLDLEAFEDGDPNHSRLPRGSAVVFVDTLVASPVLGTTWSRDRADYDLSSGGLGGVGGGSGLLSAGDNAIELIRLTSREYADVPPTGLGSGQSFPAGQVASIFTDANGDGTVILDEVVVDRFDYEADDSRHDEFFERVTDLPAPPDSAAPTWETVGSGRPSTMPGIRIPVNTGGTGGDLGGGSGADPTTPILFVQYARVARSWDIDFIPGAYDYGSGSFNAIGRGLDPRERAPRFVFGGQQVISSSDFWERRYDSAGNQLPPGSRELVAAGGEELAGDLDGRDSQLYMGIPLRLVSSLLVDAPAIDVPVFLEPAAIPADPIAQGAVRNTISWSSDAWFTYPLKDASTSGLYWRDWAFRYRGIHALDAGGNVFVDNQNPLFIKLRRKPTFFDGGQRLATSLGLGRADPNGPFFLQTKGALYNEPPRSYDRAFQLLQKEDDYQQVGELLTTFVIAHELEFDSSGGYVGTVETFSEKLRDDVQDEGRLSYGDVVGVPSGNQRDHRHAIPIMPAGLRVLSAFVCDGPGWNWDPVLAPYAEVAFGNAQGFRGIATPGLVNLNTAPVEVMQSLPHWFKAVHWEASDPAASPLSPPFNEYRRTAIADAVVAYRERYDNFAETLLPSHGIPGGPNYSAGPAGPLQDSRRQLTGATNQIMRGERGLAMIGEVVGLRKRGIQDFPAPADDPTGQLRGDFTLGADTWSAGFMAGQPFTDPTGDAVPTYGARVSTDVDDPRWRDVMPPQFRDPSLSGGPSWDLVRELVRSEGDLTAGDAEEQHLLFSGASNLVTTTSDVFTVYFRVRSFRQRPDGIWDATDPESVLDDSRYVMLVDRGRVESPKDQPRIVYLQKLRE